jgi:hypothetical protein
MEEKNVPYQIIHELGRTIMDLGGKSDILSTVFSIGDTLSDEEVLEILQNYNSQTSSF